MTSSWRLSALASRHRALGSNLEDWSGMGTAWTYDKDQEDCLLYTSPSPRDATLSRMPSSA